MKILKHVLFVMVLLGFTAGCTDTALKEAKAFEEKGEWQKAQQILQKAISKKPDDPRLQNELGFVFQKRGYYNQAVQRYNKAVSLDPYYLEAFYNRGTSNYKIARFELAKKDFEKVISLNKDYAKAYNNLGLIYNVFYRNRDESIKNFKKAIALEPENPVYHRNLSRLYLKIGKGKLAVAEEERAKILEAKQKP